MGYNQVHSILKFYHVLVQIWFVTSKKELAFKDTRKAFDDLKKNSKSVWSNVFRYVKVCIFWEFIQYTIHWDKIQMLKKLPSDRINTTKNALCFLLRASKHHNFTFNLQFLIEHMVHHFKIGCGIFHFRFHFVLIKFYIFVQQKAWALWLSNVIIPFKMKIIDSY